MAARKPLPKRRPVKKGFHGNDKSLLLGVFVFASIAGSIGVMEALEPSMAEKRDRLAQSLQKIEDQGNFGKEVVLHHEPDDAPVLRGEQAQGVAAFEKARKELKRKKSADKAREQAEQRKRFAQVERAALEAAAASAAKSVRIDKAFLLAVLQVENSGSLLSRVSSAGAIGAGQLMPATARELGCDPYHPAQNIYCTAKYLRQLLDTFGGNMLYAAIGYNMGPNATLKWIANGKVWDRLPSETQRYAEKINEQLNSQRTQLAMVEK